jgi:peptidoglycan hydrolase-like protein with peptidoglycan-binding domain
VRTRTVAALLGLTLAVAGSSTLMASPAPTTLPGSTTSAAPPAPTAGQAPAPVPVATTPSALIGPGASGDLVRNLQRRMRAKGVKVTVNGRYDSRTRAAIVTMQKRLRLARTGVADAAFLARMGVKIRGIASTPVSLPSPGPNAAAPGIAMQYLGVPYVWGGSSPKGFDCSGLVSYVYAQLGKKLPHYTVSIWNMFPVKVPYDQLAPGDLVFSRGLGHMGIYIGGGQMIHAPQTGDVVKITNMADRARSYLGAVRP